MQDPYFLNIILQPLISGSNANKIVFPENMDREICLTESLKTNGSFQMEAGFKWKKIPSDRGGGGEGGMDIFRNNRFVVTKIDM